MTQMEYLKQQLLAVLAIDSPTGHTAAAAQYVLGQYRALGFSPVLTNKGGVLVCVNEGCPGGEGGLLLEAHLDTLGAMVAEIKPNGRLRLTPLGGLNANNTEAENVRLATRSGKVFSGTFQLKNASVHVNGEYSNEKRTFDSMELVLDEDVASKEDVLALAIRTGDIACFDARTTITESGFIKSRFLDDKLSVAILLAQAKGLAGGAKKPARAVWHHITVFEEVGHGGSASVPQGVTEAISVDMGCVGDGLGCTEKQVSICAKDSGGPYHEAVVNGLVAAAQAAGVDFAVDVYPHYGSDVEGTLRAGYDVRHGLIGAGVYASHGYERSHLAGAENTLRLLEAYLGQSTYE